MNLYAYVGNDPINSNDPSGNVGVPCGGISGCLSQFTTSGVPSTGVSLAGAQSALGGVSSAARGVDIAGKTAVGLGPASAVVPGLAASQVASTVRGVVGPVRTAVSAVQIGADLHNGNGRGAATKGLELGERLAGAATGAKLLGRIGGPFSELTAAVGAAIGAAAPSALPSINQAIVDAGAAGIEKVGETYNEAAAWGGQKLMEAGQAVQNRAMGCGNLGTNCGSP